MADYEVLEHARTDLDRRLPRAGEFRANEALTAAAPEPARNAIGRLGLPMLDDLTGLVRPRFDRDVAIGAAAKAWAQPDGHSRQPAQIGSGKIFLHPGIHQDVETAKNDEIEQPEFGDDDACNPAKLGANFKAGVGPLRGNAGDADGIIEQRVMESHFSPDHGR